MNKWGRFSKIMPSLLQSLEEVDEKLDESLIENGDQNIFAENNVNFVHYT